MYSDDPQQAIPGANPGSVAPSPDPRDSELQQLREYRDRAEDYLGKLAPYKDVIEKFGDETYVTRARRLASDPEAATIYDDSLSAYEALKARRAPPLDPAWDPEKNPVVKQVVSMAEYVEGLKKREADLAQTQATEANQQVLAEANAVAQSLIEKMPWLAEDGYAGIEAIASYSVKKGVSFKAAADLLVPKFRGQEHREKTPPKSLRTEMGAAGVPGRSSSEADKSLPQYDAILNSIKRNRAG